MTRALLAATAVLLLAGCGSGSSAPSDGLQARAYTEACARVSEALAPATATYPSAADRVEDYGVVYGVRVWRVHGRVFVDVPPTERPWTVDVRADGDTWIAHAPVWED